MSVADSSHLRLTAKQVERFWSRAGRRGPQECWFWAGPVNARFGYGYFFVFGKGWRAHRLAWLLTHGPIPDGLQVLHRCDEGLPPGDISYRRCCNPAHLWLGTARQNQQDCCRKGRKPRGELHGLRKHPERAARGRQNGAHTRPERRPHGEAHGNAVITDEVVRAIRRAWDEGCPGADLARWFGISPSAACRIGNRKAWKHVE